MDAPPHARPASSKDCSPVELWPTAPRLSGTVETLAEPPGSTWSAMPRITPIRPAVARIRQSMTPGEFSRFMHLIRGNDDARTRFFLDRLLDRGVPVRRILLGLLQPAARNMGEEWEADRASFAEVTLVAARLQRIVRSLDRPHGPTTPIASIHPTRRILLGSLEGQDHTLGLIIVAELFRRAGWQVQMAAPLGTTRLSERVSSTRVHAVGLSVPLVELIPAAREEIRLIRERSANPDVGVLVGGPALLAHSDLADRVGADGSALEANLAPRIAEGFP